MLYIGRERDVKSFFVFKLCFLVAMENVLEKEIVIFDEIVFPQMPLLKRDGLQCPSVVN